MPARESYTRCAVVLGEYQVDFGLEWREGDELPAIRHVLRRLAEAHRRRSWPDVMVLSHALGDAIDAEWPGRAFFVEVSGGDGYGEWTQVFQPYGLPREERAT